MNLIFLSIRYGQYMSTVIMRFWFEVNKIGTVCHFNPSTEVFKVEQVPVEKEPGDAPKFAVCEDKQGNLWVHPVGGGLSWFDRESN